MRPTLLRAALALGSLVAAGLAAPAASADGKGSDIGGPVPETAVRRSQFGVDPSLLTDAEKEGRFKTIVKEYDELKRNQDVLQTRRRRNFVRFVGVMHYAPASKFLEGVFDTDRDMRTQVNAMVAIGQTGDLATIQSVVKKALAWLREQLPRGGTATYDAIDYGISKTKADTIYFLSDGVPSGGRYEEPERILMELRKSNRFRHVSINTVALIVGKADYESALKYEDPDEMAEFMNRIAEENYGSFADESHP